MSRWISITTINGSFEAEIIKGRLESEGLKVQIKNDAINHIYPLDNKILGGLEIQVREADVIVAVDILRENGYNITRKDSYNIIGNIDAYTKILPFVGKLPVAYRILVLAAFPALILALAIVLSAK